MQWKELRQIIQKYYTRRHFDRYVTLKDGRNVAVCYYCNEIATEHDHVPPIAYIGKELLLGNNNIMDQHELLLVPACRTCNHRLGSKALPTLEIRREYIAKLEPLRIKQFKKREVTATIIPGENGNIIVGLALELTPVQIARIIRKISRFYSWQEYQELKLRHILAKALLEYAEEKTGTYMRQGAWLDKLIKKLLAEAIEDGKA